jgi:hypothetical protein
MRLSKINIEHYREEFDKKLAREDRKKKVRKFKDNTEKNQLRLFN